MTQIVETDARWMIFGDRDQGVNITLSPRLLIATDHELFLAVNDVVDGAGC
jgi:hypothetical protein